MPNSLAALIALMVSPPALARPRICALLACACSRNDREVAGRQRVLDHAQHLAAVGLDHLGGVAFQRRAEGVVGLQEVPALAAGLGHRAAGALGQRGGVVGPVDGGGRALVVGQRRAAGAHRDEQLVLFGGHLGHGQVGAGVRAADQHVHAVGVEPFARLGGGDVGLVLVVGVDQLDLLAADGAARVGDRHLDGFDAALAVDVGVHARHVGDEADADHVARDLGLRDAGEAERADAGEGHGLEKGLEHLSVSS